MKKIVLMFLMFLSINLFAESYIMSKLRYKDGYKQETYLSKIVKESGGYAAFSVKYMKLHKDMEFLSSFKIGWLVNNKHLFGIYSCMLDSELKLDKFNENVEFRYGGFVYEYNFNPFSVINIVMSSVVGFGDINVDNDNQDTLKSDYFFVIEPKIGIDINFTKYFKTSLYISYLKTNSLKFDVLDDDDFSNVAYDLQFKFGKF